MTSYAEAQLAKLDMRCKNSRPNATGRVTSGRDILPGIDGRTIAAKRYRAIASQIVSDLAGEERVSEVKLQLVRRFAAAAVLAEFQEAKLCRGEAIDLAEHASLCGSLTKLARYIGTERVPKDLVPSLDVYLDQLRETAT